MAKIDLDDPRRCRRTAQTGAQCQNLAEPGTDRCKFHGGRSDTRPKERERMNYLSEQFANRMKIEGGDIDEVKLLKENLMNLNGVIAARINMMTDQASTLAHSPAVTELIMKAEKVTASLHRLSAASGALLGKSALHLWGQRIVLAMEALIRDKYDGWEDDLQDFATDVGTIIIETNNEEE